MRKTNYFKILGALIILGAILFVSCKEVTRPQVTLSANDDYAIVISEKASHVDSTAAQELGFFLQQIFGHEYNIIADGDYHGNHAISIGRNGLSESLYQQYDNEIKDDGFLLLTKDESLYLIGNEGKSVLYAAYHLLEKYLGCTYTCQDHIHFDALPDEVGLSIHDLQNPSFRYRETLHLIPNIDQRYADWHKLHNRNDFYKEWGLFVHTFQRLIPVDTYFDKHPEWFSFNNGRRVRDGQLCLSNPEVLEELCKNLEIMMKAEPEKQIWSVSQNDIESSCTCPDCRRLDSIYGGPSGTMLYFVNQVAARFPDKIISTLAYQHTRRPPQGIKPADNVNIMFCSIECQRQIPIADNQADASFMRDMEGWCALTDNIFLWDYVVQFRNFMDPFPNLHVIGPNLKTFQEFDIPMMFEQGSNQNITENYEWRTFLIAHLMWNVNTDTDSLRNRFMDAHYGPNRAPYIKQYLDTMQQALLDSKQVLNIYGYPINAKNGYLAPDKIKFYQTLFENAWKTAPCENISEKERTEYDNRLRLLELSLDFAILDLSMSELAPELSYFTYDEKGNRVVNPEMLAKADRFVADCDRLGVKRLDEAKATPIQLRQNIDNYISKSIQPDIARGKTVTCSTEWSNIYDVGGPKALTDGKMGIMNYNYNWLGFQGNDMDVVIDLDSIQAVNLVSIDFLLYPLSWIFIPKRVICYLSNDGENWNEVGSKTYQNPTYLLECKIENFSFTNLHGQARYVRVKAESLLTNPEWHRGVGQLCWIFCDEVIVR